MITLKTLPQATAQEVFDQVVKHLLTQNAKSITDYNCLYRGPENTKCAAGCLIGDDEFLEKMDLPDGGMGSSWKNLIERGLVPSNHSILIQKLQKIHDNPGILVEEWKEKLKSLAFQEGLKFNYEKV